MENDAYNLDALLALGVSYVNELDQEKALKNLKAWVVNNPNFQVRHHFHCMACLSPYFGRVVLQTLVAWLQYGRMGLWPS